MTHPRVCLYFSWSRPQETGADLGVLDNRFPALFEFRRAIWPFYEWAADSARYKQDVSGFLDHVILSDFQAFNAVVTEATGHPAVMVQREGDTPPVNVLDEELLRNVDVLIVVSLDHFRTDQCPSASELESVAAFVRREGTRLFVCPHHDVGAVDDTPSREIQLRHHGDLLVPSQQRIGGFARNMLAGLGFPIENQFGLSPGRAPDGSPAPLLFVDGKPAMLDGVETFNNHSHLPHFRVPPELRDQVMVLARQPINRAAAPHPFVTAGNDHFDAFLHIPPGGERGGDIFVCDATLWSGAFGGLRSLNRLWWNVARR